MKIPLHRKTHSINRHQWLSRPQFQGRSRPGLPVGVVEGFGEQPLLAAGAAAAKLDGEDLVSLPGGEDVYDGKLDLCGDELPHLTVMLGLPTNGI